MKIILWVHMTHLERLQAMVKQVESGSIFETDDPIKVSRDQMGHMWLMVVFSYDTFIALQDQQLIKIY